MWREHLQEGKLGLFPYFIRVTSLSKKRAELFLWLNMPSDTLLVLISLVQTSKKPKKVKSIPPFSLLCFQGPDMAVPPEVANVYEIGDLVPQVQ